MAKRESNMSMVLTIEDKQIDVDVFLDKNLKGIRYELTSGVEIEPLDSAFCLWLIVKSICAEAGVNPDILMAKYAVDESDITGLH